MKKILILSIFILFLFSCNKENNEVILNNNSIENEIALENNKVKDLGVKLDSTEINGKNISNNVEINRDIESNEVINEINDMNIDLDEEDNNEDDNINIEEEKNNDEDIENDNDEENEDEENENFFDCEAAYKEIKNDRRTENIEKYGKDFSKCYFDVSDIGCDNKNYDSGKDVNIQIILDYSKSMLSTIGGKTRMSIAKKALGDFLNVTNENNNIGLLAYGHKGGKCEDIEELVELGVDNRDDLLNKINFNTAKGHTPIAKALINAGNILSEYDSEDYENHILLVTDGIESCGGDPVKEARELADKGIIVSVIGFGVNNEISKELQNITEVSNGKYYLAKTLEDLEKGFRDFEQNHSCYMDEAMNVLDEGLRLSSESFNCLHDLGMEKDMELLDISLLFDAPDECKKELESKTKLRYIKLKNKINNNLKKAEDKLRKIDENNDESNKDDF